MARRRARASNRRQSAPPAVSGAPRRRAPLAGATADGLVRIGYVAGSHGLGGSLRVRTDDPASTALAAVGRVFIESAGRRREFRLLGAGAPGTGGQRVVLEGIADADAAEALRGGVVMIAAADLPALREGEFYYFQLVGAAVMLTDGRRLGTVEDVISNGAHDIWVVRAGEREVLIPVIDDVVRAMDLAARRVTIEPLAGLLD